MALKGIKVVELAGLAPSPFCGMILADFGASVIRVDKVGNGMNYDVTARGKKSIALNLKNPQGAKVLKTLCAKSDVLIEPFRAGVMEKLGLGPTELCRANPSLIYARLTGFGQDGPNAKMAGHDINYLATSGILSTIGRKDEPPLAPINLLADFAGGGLTCAMGIVTALFERSKSGQGQVIDANMVEGAAYVGSWIYLSQKMMLWGQPRGQNVLDSGAHFYETYRTKDGKFMAVGAIEPQFYAEMLKRLDIQDLPQGINDDEAKAEIRKVFLSKTRQEWSEIFEGSDACVTPILELHEAPEHPHNHARNSFVKNHKGDILAPVPAPRLSRTPAVANTSMPEPQMGENTADILQDLGYSRKDIEKLQDEGAVEINSCKSKL